MLASANAVLRFSQLVSFVERPLSACTHLESVVSSNPTKAQAFYDQSPSLGMVLNFQLYLPFLALYTLLILLCHKLLCNT